MIKRLRKWVFGPADTREVETLRAALSYALKNGDHSVFCRAPPHEVLAVGHEARRVWQKAHPDCDCWKKSAQDIVIKAGFSLSPSPSKQP